MIIAIASGKGGTGKTTVAVNMARVLKSPVRLLDCDVEEPNAHLFLECETIKEDVVSVPVPEVNEALCDACASIHSGAGVGIVGECAKICEFNAIVSFGTTPLVFPEMCHGCGGCMRVCPKNAIREIDNRIGVVSYLRSGNIRLIQGRLDVGVAMAPPLIREVMARGMHKSGGVFESAPVIMDAPPGTSCPVVTTVRGADVVVLVTEPTPFGLHDLTLAIDMTKDLGLPFGVVVNRMGIGDDRVHSYCNREGIPIFAEIPDDRRIAEAYSRGELIVDALPEYEGIFRNLAVKLEGVARSGVYE